jgi:lipopolysaccharide transport system ATP-binding protein
MIKVSNLSKGFKLYQKPSDRLKEVFSHRKFHTYHQALKDISFEVKSGKTLGIIGENGAGKSTILKILTGILIPDNGKIEIDGRITGLLELGTGFNYELTGLQNIYMNGTLIGMTREEIDQKRQQIIDFTELGEFIHEALKTYSSGMLMRLAFSIAIFANPQCFVIDEALAVGDAYFQQKCMQKINEFKKAGGAIIFVSHDINAIKMLCDEAILLKEGLVEEKGAPEDIIILYNFQLTKKHDHTDRIRIDNSNPSSFGDFGIKVKKVALQGEKSGTGILCSGEKACIKIELESRQDTEDLSIGIQIKDRFGQIVFGTNTFHLNQTVSFIKDRTYTVEFRCEMNIGVGKYTLTCALHTGDTHIDQCYHWIENISDFEVSGIEGNFFEGLCKLEPEFKISTT